MTNPWHIVSDGTSMYRPKGRTWPCVELSGSKVYARDNNSKHPSETLITEDISVDGVKALLKRGISLPHPTEEMIEQFVAAAKKRLQ